MTQLRYEPRHFHQHRFPRLRTANAAATLSVLGVVAAVLPWVGWPKQVTVGVLVLTVLIGLGLVTAPPTRALKRGGIAPGARWHWGAAMLLGMSPAILLGLSFPVVSQKMAASTVSGTGLPVIVLSVSVAVPWLSQIIGTPVYRLLGDSIGRGPRAVLERYCSIWPALFLWALLPTALEILVVAAVTGWNLHVLGVHTALLLLHVVFVQSLIVADVAGRRVATSYDVLVRNYLAARGVDAQTVHLDGAVESSVQLGVADLIADVVETGTTLRAAGLETFGDPILVSEAVLITTEQFRAEPGLATLVRRLEGVLRARAYVLVDYDIPMNKLHLATSLTPGIESPTVSPLQNPDWVAVRAMVPRADMNRVMDELYEVGARAILVSSLLACRL